MSRRRRKPTGKNRRVRRNAELLIAMAYEAAGEFHGDFTELAAKLGWTNGTFWRENPAIRLAEKRWLERGTR